ncbi:MAG: YbaK/EbsC family protein [Chlamydiales bacterium]|nr:YbaK/EbsC family protein [Chlamydiales bacterium]
MSISNKLRDLLTKHKITFEAMQHPVAYTIQEVAGAQHVSGDEAIKSVIVKVDGKCIMCVLSAVSKVDLEKLKRAVKGKSVQLAGEDDLAKLFPDYELGAEPPFGNLYGLDVYVDRTLENHDTVVFNAGTHTDTVRMRYSDFAQLAKPRLVDIGTHV